MSSPPSTNNNLNVDLASLHISAPHNAYDGSSGANNNGSPNPNYYATAPAAGPNPYASAAVAQPSFADGPYINTTMGLSTKAPAQRGGLPTQWFDQGASQTQDSRSLSPPSTDVNSAISSSGSPPPQAYGAAYHHQGMMLGQPQQQIPGQPIGGADDDIIPTAIVIKNIPFSVKRETLLDIIASLQIPTPYAFNYHLDAAGAFRGLAFANFRLPQDADAVVAALNGFDVQGRKLRVEYKKVLQAGEKERIEREKAIRRMRSMQMEKEKAGLVSAAGLPPPPPPQQSDWEDYGVVQQHHQYGNSPMLGGGPSLMGGLDNAPMRGFGNTGPTTPNQHSQGLPISPQIPPVPQIPQQYFTSPHRQQSITPQVHLSSHSPPPHMDDPYGQPQQYRSFSPPSHTSASPPLQAPTSSPLAKAATELDLNDASTLEIYSRILVFKEDRMRDELAFSRTLTAKQRRVVHLVAQKLGVYHYSVGEGEDRYAVVTRIERDNRPPTTQRHNTLSRAQSYLTTSGLTGSPTRLSPSSASNSSALRAKKSMPDLSTLHAPSPRLNSRASNGNIREGYHTISTSRRVTPSFNGLFNNGGSDIPPVPSLPTPGESPSQGSGVVRQPRGPGIGGFGRRPSAYGAAGDGAPAGASGAGAQSGLNTRSHEPLEI